MTAIVNQTLEVTFIFEDKKVKLSDNFDLTGYFIHGHKNIGLVND